MDIELAQLNGLQVYLMLVVQQELGSSVNITFMPWSDFLSFILSRDFRKNLHNWEEEYDLILGAVDYSTEYM